MFNLQYYGIGSFNCSLNQTQLYVFDFIQNYQGMITFISILSSAIILLAITMAILFWLTRSQKRCFEMHLLLRHLNSSEVHCLKSPEQIVEDSSWPSLQSVSPSHTHVFGMQLKMVFKNCSQGLSWNFFNWFVWFLI